MQEHFFNITGAERRSSEMHDQITCPRTGKPLWQAPLVSKQDLDDAVKIARTSSKPWAKTSLESRQNLLLKFASEIAVHAAFLSRVLARETGKTRLIIRSDSCSLISLADEVVFEDATVKVVATHTPLGVVAAICPWNSPLVLATGKIAAGLLTGNCVIVKPSPFTPYTTLKVIELAMEIFPPGVLQALNGGTEVGRELTLHPGIDKISFTGSTATGKRIMEAASGSLKRITLELGGNDATIICDDVDDVDVASVARQVAQGCLFHSDQMCVATKRVYVLVKEFEVVKTRTSADTLSTFGPSKTTCSFLSSKTTLETAKLMGTELPLVARPKMVLVYGYSPPLWIDLQMIPSSSPASNLVICAEQSPIRLSMLTAVGPIPPVLEWQTKEEVIKRANDTSSGPGACVWSKDSARAERIGRRLEAGSVWLDSFEKPLPTAYFSGHKEGGIGGEWGRQGLLSYVNTQSLHMYKGPALGRL